MVSRSSSCYFGLGLGLKNLVLFTSLLKTQFNDASSSNDNHGKVVVLEERRVCAQDVFFSVVFVGC